MKNQLLLLLLVAGGLFIVSCSKSDVDELNEGLIARAGEPGSGGAGGGGGGTNTCNPIQSFTVKGDYRAGETGLSSIDVSYSVKACVNGQNLSVSGIITDYDTKEIMYNSGTLPLSGKFTFRQTGLYGLYQVVLYVTDSDTGTLVSSTSTVVALVPKRV